MRQELPQGPGETHGVREQAIRDGAGLGGDDDSARPAGSAAARTKEIDIPIQYNSVDEPSQITYLRLREVLSRWRKSIVAGRLKRDQKTRELHRADPGQGRGRGHRAAR